MMRSFIIASALAAAAVAAPAKHHQAATTSSVTHKSTATPMMTIPTSALNGTSSNSTSSGNSTGDASACFPYGSAKLNTDYSAPSQSRDEWWCPTSMQYGFQGFSYALEDSDCSADSNGFDAMNKDFAQMKKDFGATIVRLYYPGCADKSVFINALKAGVANNMAVIPQVWFNFGDGDVWKQSQQAIYDVFEDETVGKIAPYVFHSADFGSEPIGDGVDNGNDQFVKDLATFKQKMNSYGVPAGISEDWDRPGTMSNNAGNGLADIGSKVKAASDYVHAHIMPYYHGNLQESQTWDYISKQISFLHDVVKMPIFITETQWAWGDNDHYPNHNDVGVSQYTAYWQKFDDECETLKANGVGWFLHDWRGEGTFDILKDDGSYVIKNFKPRKC